MRPTELLATILLITSTSASVWDPIHGLQHDVAALLRRQNDASTSYDLSFSGTQGNTATTESSAESTAKSDGDSTSTADKSDASSTGDADNTSSGDRSSGTAKETGTSTGKNSAKGTSTKTFDARLPAGGVSMITPNAQSTSYYKIKDYITFAWNYTSLSVTPSAVDILASCSLNQETYTIALNQSITGPTQHLTWDTGAFQASATVPLLTETYTLIIHDAAKDASATAQAGYLGTYNQFTFGMYSPQAYTPIADYVCATCNGALSLSERQTLWALFAMAGVTVLSFSWFTGVAGLW